MFHHTKKCIVDLVITTVALLSGSGVESKVTQFEYSLLNNYEVLNLINFGVGWG